MSPRLLLSFVFCLFTSAIFSQQQGYYRCPALYKNTVVFTAEGDLWKYDLVAGSASRLTTHSGLERNPHISPDGQWVVFTGQYEGPNDLYVMPLNGGVPKRVTYDLGETYQAEGWTTDGKILISTTAYSPLPVPQLSLLDPMTLTHTQVPLWQAAMGAYDDKGVLYFTRFPNQGSKTKRYKGGLIEQVWKFDGVHEATNLTGDFDGTSTSPMFFSGHVYFLSDRDGTMNLWSMDGDGKGLKQLTFSKGWDIQTPTIYQSSVIYQKGADIWIYEISTNKERMLDIKLVSDFDQRKPKWIKGPVNSISNSALSPNGNYAAIVSRGRVFVSPAKSDRWVEVTRKSGIRYKNLQFINDRTLAVLSDASGEFEVWKLSADGSDTAVQITKNSKTLISQFAVSPDEKLIAYADKNMVLRIADVATGQVRFMYDSTYGGFEEMSWSPDSRFLNVTEDIENLNYQLKVIDRQTMKMVPLSTPRINSYSASWSADSNWIYFASDRNLVTKVHSPWGPHQPEPVYNETSGIFALSLDSAGKFPFLLTDSWLTDSLFNKQAGGGNSTATDGSGASSKTSSGTSAKKEDARKAKAAALKNYNWDKIRKRLYQVPIKSDNIRQIGVGDGYLYWVTTSSDENATDGGKLFALKIGENKKYEPTEVASGITGFEVSANRKKIMVSFMNRNMAISDANGQKIDMEKSKLSLENWAFQVQPQLEWHEMFNDAWRMMRDYFYDRDLHKVDWVAIRNQYEPLLTRVTDRYELDDVLSQMVGELSALHTFVGGGDKRRSPDMIPTGFLGAMLSKTKAGARIDHIYRSDPDYPMFSSPLNKPELNIMDGDVITAVNNSPLSEVNDIAELLANKVGVPVKLTLNNKAGKSYQQIVTPCSSTDNYTLKYEEWELDNRLKVDSMSDNEIGYVHLKAMGSNDMDDFVKQFYPIFTRKGLVIDVRQNFGGNIDSWVLEKLMRKVWMYWQSRAGKPTWNMQYAFRGHMVILCDQQTASDGEAISEGFRRLGLGKVIGMRTWGGEIWLSGGNRMVDNGAATAAENGVFGPEGTWLIEGRGVEPDITVDNLPMESFKGKDAQLEYAIDYLKKLIKDKPVDAPVVPAHPDKSFKY